MGRTIALFLTFLTFWPTAVFGSDIKPRIASLLFVPQNAEGTLYMDTLPTLLTMAVNRSGAFEILEKKKVERAIELEGYRLTGITPEQLIAIGNKYGFDFMVFGTVSKESGIITAQVKLLNVRNQTIVFEHLLRTTEGGLNENVNTIAAMLIEKTRQFPAAAAMAPLPTERPPPPLNLEAKGGPRRIVLSWNQDSPQAIFGYKIFRAKQEGEPYLLVGSVHEMSFADENPILDHPACYKIKAVGKNGQESEFSNTIEARARTGLPPPIFLDIDPDVKGARLKWRPRPGCTASGYRIYRREEGMDFRAIASLSGEATAYTDKGLRENTGYSYSITSLDPREGESDSSQILVTKSLKAPDGLQVQGGKIRRVMAAWTPHPSPNIVIYKLYRAPAKDGEYQLIARIEDKTSVLFHDIKGLGDGQPYWYRISGCNPDGEETELSAAVSATTRDCPPCPKDFSARDREPRMASLQWTPVRSPEDEIRGYYIYRAPSESGDFRRIAQIDDPKASSHADKDPPLQDNITYYYKIAVYNSAGAVSDLSEPVSSTTKNIPAAPRAVEARSEEVKQVTLSWEANPEKDIGEYQIFRRSPGEREFEKIASVKVTGYIDLGLKDGSTYVYALQAVDPDRLVSERSPSVEAKTKPLPSKPKGLKIVDKGGQKLLEWESSSEKDIKYYIIYRKGFLGISQKVTSVSEASFTIDGSKVKGGQRIYVTAVDESGLESEASDLIAIDKK